VAYGRNEIMSSLWLPKILSWTFGPARYLLLALWASYISFAGPPGQKKFEDSKINEQLKG